MEKDEAQKIFHEKRQAIISKILSHDFKDKELEDIMKEVDEFEESKELKEAFKDLNKAKEQ